MNRDLLPFTSEDMALRYTRRSQSDPRAKLIAHPCIKPLSTLETVVSLKTDEISILLINTTDKKLKQVKSGVVASCKYKSLNSTKLHVPNLHCFVFQRV